MTVNGLELTTVDEWIYSTLAGDNTLVGYLGDGGSSPGGPGVFMDTIRDDTTYPYVIGNLMISMDTLTSSGDSLIVVADYTIKGVDRAVNYDVLAHMHQRMFQLLHNQSGTTADGRVLKCLRQRQVKYSRINETIQYRHLGGIYRFWVEGL